MYQDFWNSPAAVVRTGEGVLAPTVAVGRLFEIVDVLLAAPIKDRSALRLRVETLEHPLDVEAVRFLRSRADFPIVC